MARVPMESFEEGTELVRVYLAAALEEARRIEEVLGAAAVEFAVEVEEFASPTALGSNQARRWAGFWVRQAELDRAADALERGGHVAGLVRR
ncbi:MAG TPA: hypothetical protein VF875_16615 [Anaeromyxobacter sp.]